MLSWGRATGIPVVALRYSCTFGPRQSLFNPYTGVIAIFCTRLMNDLPPCLEDGRQSRDLIFVEDVARANLMVAKYNNAPMEESTMSVPGRRPRIDALPHAGRSSWQTHRTGFAREFRPGEMRALISDTTAIAALNDSEIDLAAGIDRYLAWIETQGTIADYFTAAERNLRRRSLIKSQRSGPAA